MFRLYKRLTLSQALNYIGEVDGLIVSKWRDGKRVDYDVINDKVDYELWQEGRGNALDEERWYLMKMIEIDGESKTEQIKVLRTNR